MTVMHCLCSESSAGRLAEGGERKLHIMRGGGIPLHIVLSKDDFTSLLLASNGRQGKRGHDQTLIFIVKSLCERWQRMIATLRLCLAHLGIPWAIKNTTICCNFKNLWTWKTTASHDGIEKQNQKTLPMQSV